MSFIDAAKATAGLLRAAAREGASYVFSLWFSYRRAREHTIDLEGMERLSGSKR